MAINLIVKYKLVLHIGAPRDDITIGNSELTSTSFQSLRFLSGPATAFGPRSCTRQITFLIRVLQDFSHASPIANETSNLVESPVEAFMSGSSDVESAFQIEASRPLRRERFSV